MKKILILAVALVLLGSSIAVTAINVSKEAVEEKEESSKSTHTVFGEYGTATWCGYCKYAHGALKQLYSEGQLDFLYVSLVTDMNSKAYTRALNGYNVYGYPTVWWDGGYDVDVGAGSIPGAKSTYTSSINYCSNREVEDIDIDLEVYFLGGTEIQVDAMVTNNEGSTYGGTIRVYITEKVSSMGWQDTAGIPYTFPFLDWAFNEQISISSGDSWSDSMTWDGASNGYSSVTPENLMIIAACFNDEANQGYSYPPSSNPFDAYYVDDVIAAEPIQNMPPNEPIISGPETGEPLIEYEYSFIANDPDQDDIYIWIDWGDGEEGWLGPYSSGEEILISHTFDEEGIYGITAKAKDINDNQGDWSEAYEVIIGNIEPNIPDITGPTNGNTGTEYDYKFSTTDPNIDDVYFYIKWGDGNTVEWDGPYSSGEEITLSHKWNSKGKWIIQAKAKDEDGKESDWGSLEVNIPRSRTRNFNLLYLIEKFFENHPLIKNKIGK